MYPENDTPQDAQWYEAQRWLWHQRRHARPGADIWHLRFHWQTENERLWRLVQEGAYRLTPMKIYRRADGEGLAQWTSPDALVLKWCALHIDNRLPVHERCEHRRGNGGYVASVRKVREALATPAYQEKTVMASGKPVCHRQAVNSGRRRRVYRRDVRSAR